MIISHPSQLKSVGLLHHGYAFLGGTPNVQATKETPLGNQFAQTLGGFASTAQPFFNLNQQIQPQYGGLDLQLLQEQMFGQPASKGTPNTTQTINVPQFGQGQGRGGGGGKFLGNTTQTVTIPGQPGHPGQAGTLSLGELAASSLRGADIRDVMAMGPAATQAYLAANPYLKGSLGSLYNSTVGSPLLAGLNSQAEQQLKQGGQLSPQETYDLNQQTLAGFQQQGNATGNQALGAELLNRDAAQRQRLAAAQQFAQGVQGLNTDTYGKASQIFQQTLGDPYQQILGRSSGAGLFGGAGAAPISSGVGPGSAASFANNMFSPTNPYSQDFFNTQFNANAAANIANANNSAANNAANLGFYGSVIKGLGSAIGGGFCDRRIKERIKKVGKTKNGIGIYEFNYKGSNKRFRGPIADDVEKKNPGAVSKIGGVKFVDMNKAGVPFQRVGRFDFVNGPATRKAA